MTRRSPPEPGTVGASPSPSSAATWASTRPNAASSAFGSIIRNTVRIGIMRGDRMPELQEVPENMLFCATEVCHLGTAGRPAEPCCEAHDQQFAKVVLRVVGPGVGDVIEGGKEDVHAGNGLQNGDPRPRIHPPENRKTPRISANPKRDSPAPRDRGLHGVEIHLLVGLSGPAKAVCWRRFGSACRCGQLLEQRGLRTLLLNST